MTLKEKIRDFVRATLKEERKFFKSDEEAQDWRDEFLGRNKELLSIDTSGIFYLDPEDIDKYYESSAIHDDDSGEEVDSYISGAGPWIVHEEITEQGFPTLRAALLAIKKDPEAHGLYDFKFDKRVLSYINKILKIPGFEAKCKGLRGGAPLESFEELYNALTGKKNKKVVSEEEALIARLEKNPKDPLAGLDHTERKLSFL